MSQSLGPRLPRYASNVRLALPGSYGRVRVVDPTRHHRLPGPQRAAGRRQTTANGLEEHPSLGSRLVLCAALEPWSISDQAVRVISQQAAGRAKGHLLLSSQPLDQSLKTPGRQLSVCVPAVDLANSTADHPRSNQTNVPNSSLRSDGAQAKESVRENAHGRKW